jgi:hypothetical protein
MGDNIKNHLINIAWTVVGFLPICLFWYREGATVTLYAFLILGFISGCLPNKVYARIHVSKNLKWFENIGVKFIRKFTQTGNFSNYKRGGLVSYLRNFLCMNAFIICALYSL